MDPVQLKIDIISNLEMIKSAVDQFVQLEPWTLKDINLRFVFDYSLSNMLTEMDKVDA
jgi:hypothetical protein